MVAIKNELVPSSVARNVTSAGTNRMSHITIHETGNTKAGADAAAHARLQKNGNSRDASWHITVDDKTAIRSFNDTAICWHSGAKYPKVSGNPISIGIEICVNSDGNYAKAVENAASVVAQLMKAHNIPITNVVQHNHWSGKNCPERMRSGKHGITWTEFKAMAVREYSGVGTAAKPSQPTVTLPYNSVLSLNSQGVAVKRYQTDLNTLGYKTDADGYFGNGTLASTKSLQKDNGLTVDGYAGSATQAALVRRMAEHKADSQPKPVVPPSFAADSKGDDEMNQLLNKTQKDDMRKLLKVAFDSKVFSVDHTDKVDTMTRAEAFDLIISYVARTAK